MKHILRTIFRAIYSIVNIQALQKENATKSILIPIGACEFQKHKRFTPNSLFTTAGCLIAMALMPVLSQGQTYLSSGSNLDITTNTTYTGAGIYAGTVTVKTGVTVIFTGGVGLSNTAKFVIEAGATVIINSGGFSTSSSAELTTATGSKLIIIDGGLNVNNSSKITSNGSLAVRGGGLMISSSAILGLFGVNQDTIIGAVSLNNTTATTIDTGVELYIQGNVTSTSSAGMAINGNVAIDGNYQSYNSATITGTGDISTTGSMNAGGSSSIFGVSPYSCGGPGCNGRNACGRTAVASTGTTGVCSGSSVTLTGVLSGSGGKTYQWLSSTTLGGAYSTISGATSSTYTFTATATKYYKVRMTASSCTSTSNIISVAVYTTSTAPTGTSGVTSICAGSATTLTATGGSLSSEAKAVWYEGTACGGFTENWTTQPYTTVRTTVNGAKGILNVTSAFDSWIEMYSLGSFNPNTYKYINIRYRVLSGNAGDVQMYFTNSTYTTANENAVVVRPLNNDGNWQVLTINMSTHTLWTSSNVTGWRYDFASGAATMEIDYISLTSAPAGDNSTSLSSTFSPTVNTTYQVRYEGVCNVTTCRSVLVTVTPAPTAVAGTAITTCSNSGAINITGGSSSINKSGIVWTSSGTGSFTNATSLSAASYTASAEDKTDGSVTLTLTATGNAGACSSTTAVSTKTLTIVAAPTASAGGSQTICLSTTATVSGVSASNGTIAWTHNGVGSITSGATTVSPVYTPAAGDAGNTVTLTITVSNGTCTNATATYSVLVSTCSRTWTGASSNAWGASNNWLPSNIPTPIDDVVIPSSVSSGRMPTIATSVANAKSLSNNGVITFTSVGILNLYGNISNTGTVNTVAGSTVAFKGNTAQILTGVPVLYNVEIANTSGGVSLSSAVAVRGALTLTSGVLTTNSNLTINFDNGGNIAYNASDAGSISGIVSGRRDAIARTHYIAAPFSGVTSTQIDATSPLFYNGYWKMYTKTFATQGWDAVRDLTTAMSLGSGFSLAMPAAAALILTGTYNHSYSLSGTPYSNTVSGNYILTGNPYPAALDWDASGGWTKTNVADAVYYWNAATSTMSSYVAGVGTNGGTRYIPAMQSFMVSTTGTGGATASVSVSNAARVNLQNPSFLRTGSDETIRIKLTGVSPDQWDDAVIRFNDQATTSFDFDWDAYKIVNRGPNPLIYTTLGGDVYSINSVSGVDSLPIVDLILYIPSDGNYTLDVANSDASIEYILVDKKMATENALLGSSYVFSGLTTDDVNRFQLQLRTAQTTGTYTANSTGGLQINSSTKGFVIKTDQFGGQSANIELLDMTGNLIKVLNNTALTTGSTYVPIDLSSGSYLVKVAINGNIFTGMISLLR